MNLINLLMEFPAHNALPINRCQFIYEDSVIITCSDDKTIGLWDSASGDCRHLLAGHQHSVKDMDLVERIHKIVTVSWDKSAIYWDYATGKKLWANHHETLLTSCAMAEDLIAIACDTQQFCLIDTRTGKITDKSKEKKGHSNTITCCKISNDGVKLCTCSMDRTAIVWDLRMLRKLLRLSNHINVVNSCTFSHNDHYLCTSSWDKSLLLYDVNSGNYRKNGPGLLQGHDGSVSRCIFSSDGSLLASCGYDKNVMLWNPHTLEFIGGLKDDKDWIYDLHLSRNGKTIVTCSKSGFIKLWDTEAANKAYKSKHIGLNMSKCRCCRRSFSYSEDGQHVPALCVFCRMDSPQNSIKSIVAPLR